MKSIRLAGLLVGVAVCVLTVGIVYASHKEYISETDVTHQSSPAFGYDHVVMHDWVVSGEDVTWYAHPDLRDDAVRAIALWLDFVETPSVPNSSVSTACIARFCASSMILFRLD